MPVISPRNKDASMRTASSPPTAGGAGHHRGNFDIAELRHWKALKYFYYTELGKIEEFEKDSGGA